MAIPAPLPSVQAYPALPRRKSNAGLFSVVVFALVLTGGLFLLALGTPSSSASSSTGFFTLDSGQVQVTQHAGTAAAIADDDGRLIQIPVSARFVQSETEKYSTTRSVADAQHLISQANTIWEDAHIHFSLQDAGTVHPEVEDVRRAFALRVGEDLPRSFNVQPSGRPTPTVYFVGTLDGPNGFAVTPLQIAFVADTTTNNDARTLAHELGHLMGLSHEDDPTNLMASGKAGTRLTPAQIAQSRAGATQIAG